MARQGGSTAESREAAEHAGGRGAGRQGKPRLKVMHLEGALCKPSSIIKLLRARGIGGGFVGEKLRLG